MNTRLLSIPLMALAALALSACASMDKTPIIGSITTMGIPAGSFTNSSTVPVLVTIWTTERADDYQGTWKDMADKLERIDPGAKVKFVLRDYDKAADPILRIQIQTRGPSFEPDYEYWFELLTQPGFKAEINGLPADLTLDSSDDRFVRIPDKRIHQDLPKAVTHVPHPVLDKE